MRGAGEVTTLGPESRRASPRRRQAERTALSEGRLLAAGPTREVFTTENLQKTYGGKLTLLDQAAEAMRREGRQ